MQIHCSLKNEILKNVFHSKQGLLRRTCCCYRCLYIRKEEKKKKKKKKRSTWVKPWLTQRDALGFYNTLMYELRIEDVEKYTRFLSVSPCFLYMVVILPFFISTLLLSCEKEISQERIFLFEHDHTGNIWLANSTPLHFNRVSLNSKGKVFIKKTKFKL